jgi:hypothetical protein
LFPHGAKGDVETGEKISAALSAEGEELWKLIREHRPEIILNATLNRHLTEDMAVFIARKKTVSSETLEFLAGDVRFKDSYKLKLALCKNPRTPQRVTFAQLKFLRIFDLSDLTKEQILPLNVRQKIEQSIGEKIPSLPLGVRTALARRANSAIVALLMEKGDENVVSACLDSPALTEGLLHKIISRKTTQPLVVRSIAEHPKWSLRYSVKFGLIRNFNTPMACVVKFIEGMKATDLRDLYADPKLPAGTRPFIFRELAGRNETVDMQKQEIYSIEDEEGPGLPSMNPDDET